MMPQLMEAGRTASTPTQCSGPQRMDRAVPAHTGRGHLLYSAHQSKCSSFQKPPSQTHLEILLNQQSGHPWPRQADASS